VILFYCSLFFAPSNRWFQLLVDFLKEYLSYEPKGLKFFPKTQTISLILLICCTSEIVMFYPAHSPLIPFPHVRNIHQHHGDSTSHEED
jgi:hypothetical protein